MSSRFAPRVRGLTCRAPVLLLLASALLVSTASRAHALEEHKRDGWVAGIGFGFGHAKFQGGEALNHVDAGWEEGTTPRFRIGHMLGKRVMLGYEQFQWFDEQGFGTTAVRVSAQTFGAAINPEWQILAGHLAFLVVLLVRPRGLFPRAVD